MENSDLEFIKEEKQITEQEFLAIKNIVEDNQKIFSIQKTVASTAAEVENLVVRLGNLLHVLHQVKIDVDGIEHRMAERFDLLNDKFISFLDQIIREKDLTLIENVLQQKKVDQAEIMERIIKKRNKV